MTEREAAIVSAYTGILIGSFSAMHGYVEELLGRPVWTHQFADDDMAKKIKDMSRDDFLGIEVVADGNEAKEVE